MKVIQIPLLRDNYGYLIVSEKTNQAAIVDPSEAEPVLRQAEKEKVTLKAILNTHHHRDHTGGNSGLLESLPLQVYGHKNDQGRIPGLTHPLDDGDEVTIDDLRARVFFIPGHTKGHIAYLFENKLFCGDTLFTAGCGRLFEGTAEQMHSSLNKLQQLPADTLVYCGHEYTEKNLQFAMTVEPNNKNVAAKLDRVRSMRAKGISTVPSTMAEEKQTNPFLRWDSKEIQENLKSRFPNLGSDPVSIFAKVRELKDQF
ncbi:MAG: hydroxyacylglutathione hydrolase [Candidatus Binatia bacterium]